VIKNWKYTPAPYFLVQEKGKFEVQASYFTQQLDTAYVSDVAKSTAASCTFPHVLEYATCLVILYKNF
jgi:hypothetical protein